MDCYRRMMLVVFCTVLQKSFAGVLQKNFKQHVIN